MSRVKLSMLGLLLLSAPALAGQRAVGPVTRDAAPVFSSGVDMVTVNASVRDSRGRLVRGLACRDFRLVDSGFGRPIRSVFESRRAAPHRGAARHERQHGRRRQHRPRPARREDRHRLVAAGPRRGRAVLVRHRATRGRDVHGGPGPVRPGGPGGPAVRPDLPLRRGGGHRDSGGQERRPPRRAPRGDGRRGTPAAAAPWRRCPGSRAPSPCRCICSRSAGCWTGATGRAARADPTAPPFRPPSPISRVGPGGAYARPAAKGICLRPWQRCCRACDISTW